MRQGTRMRLPPPCAMLAVLAPWCAALWLGAAGAAFAQGAAAPPAVTAEQPNPAAEAVKSVAGAWEISNAERDRTCLVTLRAPAGAGNGTLAWEPKCAELFSFAREAVAWTIGAGDWLRFLDAKGQILVELSEVEGGLYEGERRGEGLVFLQSAAAGAAEERGPESLAGEWAFVNAAGRTVCRVTLTTTPKPPEALALTVRPGCAAPVAAFAPAAWQFDRGQLVLIPARGEVWRFEEVETATWQRVPQQRQPLRLVKQ